MNMPRRGASCRRRCNPPAGARRGFALLELVGIIVIASILSLFFYDRLRRYQALAEKQSMEMTVRNMRSGLQLRVAELMMADRMDQAGQLVQENPIRWLATPPPNYLGEISNPRSADIPLNSWYFDPDRHELVYLLRRNKFFGPDPADEKPIVFRVTAVDRGSSIPGRRPHKVEGVALLRDEGAR